MVRVVPRCRPDQILNPATNRCVSRNGAIGKRLLAQQAQVPDPQAQVPEPQDQAPVEQPPVQALVEQPRIRARIPPRGRARNQPSSTPRPPLPSTIDVALFYEECQLKLENQVPITPVDDETRRKIIKYNLGPIVYLPNEIIRDIIGFYSSGPVGEQIGAMSKFWDLVFNQAHITFLKSSFAISKRISEAHLLITQWLNWYYRHTLKEAGELIDRLKLNVGKIREYLPGVYKPEKYIELFTDFFFNDYSLIAIRTSPKYNDLNFYLHEPSSSQIGNTYITKMMTGLRNFNLLHEWVDSRLRENDMASLNIAKDRCVLGDGRVGAWICGDAMFDSIPALLTEFEGSINWIPYTGDPSNAIGVEDNLVENIRSIAVSQLRRSGKNKRDFPAGYLSKDFLNFVMNILWKTRTFRLNFGFNKVQKLEAMFSNRKPFNNYMERYGVDVLESIYDTLPDN